MITRAQIKSIRSLHQKKYRDKQGLFIAEGPKVVGDLLNSDFKLRDLLVVKGHQVSLEKFKPAEISQKDLEAISTLSTPNQMLATFEISEPKLEIEKLKKEMVLALDDIRDPGNLGTIVRIADWFGIKHILCSKTCVDLFNPKVIQAAMGSIARVNVYYVELDKTLSAFAPVYATVLDGRNLYDQKLQNRGVILIGNESKGISDSLLQKVTDRISIPGFSTGADSLNAAVATAVVCAEFRRVNK